MRRSVAPWTFAAVMTAVIVSICEPAPADSPEFVSATEFESLKQRFEEYERRLNAVQYRPSPRYFCHPCSTKPGITFNAEVTFLKPYQSEGEAPGFDHEAAPRLTLGYTGREGLGVRVRWFDYETVSPANMQGFRDDIDLYTNIRGAIAELTNTLKDMNTLTAEIHRDSDFEALIEAIATRL